MNESNSANVDRNDTEEASNILITTSLSNSVNTSSSTSIVTEMPPTPPETYNCPGINSFILFGPYGVSELGTESVSPLLQIDGKSNDEQHKDNSLKGKSKKEIKKEQDDTNRASCSQRGTSSYNESRLIIEASQTRIVALTSTEKSLTNQFNMAKDMLYLCADDESDEKETYKTIMKETMKRQREVSMELQTERNVLSVSKTVVPPTNTSNTAATPASVRRIQPQMSTPVPSAVAYVPIADRSTPTVVNTTLPPRSGSRSSTRSTVASAVAVNEAEVELCCCGCCEDASASEFLCSETTSKVMALDCFKNKMNGPCLTCDISTDSINNSRKRAHARISK